MTFDLCRRSKMLSVAAILLLVNNVGSAETLVMPRDLVEYAKTMKCIPIADFYERVGMIEPPYVYGVVPGEKSKSAALWCERIERGDKPYVLLFMIAGESDVGGCPIQIDWWNPTGGLSVEHRDRLSLKGFRYVSNPEKRSTDITVQGKTVIVSSYDGVSAEFLCHQGSWLFSISH